MNLSFNTVFGVVFNKRESKVVNRMENLLLELKTEVKALILIDLFSTVGDIFENKGQSQLGN